MTKTKEKELFHKYPKILGGQQDSSPEDSCLAFGIECDDGWFNLIDGLLNKLQYLCDIFSTKDNEVQIIATQIKEKYGVLCFYSHIIGASNIESEIFFDVIDAEERKSKYICEETGLPGALCSRGGWLRTLSRSSARKHQYSPIDKDLAAYWEKKNLEEDEKNSAKLIN